MPAAKKKVSLHPRVHYVLGSGDVVEAYRQNQCSEQIPCEVAQAYSNQVAEVLRGRIGELRMVSRHTRMDRIEDGTWTIENRPIPNIPHQGLRYHWEFALVTLRLMQEVLRYRPDVLFLTSGQADWRLVSFLRLWNIKIVPVMHNTLWSAGNRPQSFAARVSAWIDAFFWRSVPFSVLGVSSEVKRQIEELVGPTPYPIHVFQPQFFAEYFQGIVAPVAVLPRPIVVLFVGRLEVNKGVFDLLTIAETLEKRRPGVFRWELCGNGTARQDLLDALARTDLGDRFKIHGEQHRDELAASYGRSHVVIVPTKRTFEEGFAKVAAEAILAGRPCLLNPAVPARDVLGPACLVAETDNVDSYVEQLERLVVEPSLWPELCAQASKLQPVLLDPASGIGPQFLKVLDALG